MFGGWGRGSASEACPSVSSNTSALCLPFLPQESLCSLAVSHFWPPESGNPGFSQEGPSSWHWVRGMDVMMASPQDLGPQRGQESHCSFLI